MSTQHPNDHDLSISIINRVSKLARINIRKSEQEGFINSMDNILNMLHQLDALDLSQVSINENKALAVEQARSDIAQDDDMSPYMSEHLPAFDEDSSLFHVPEFIDQD